MITTQRLLQLLRGSFENVKVSYSYPSLCIDVACSDFKDDDLELTLEVVAKKIETDLVVLQEALNRPLVSIAFFQRKEDMPHREESPSDYWLAVSDKEKPTRFPQQIGSSPRAIHFYGYKGGQGRSTVLALLAKNLADSGLKVLLVDADIEAPSLHVLFDCAIPNLSASLMGAAEPYTDIIPVIAYSRRGMGTVGLIGCRPSSDEFDLDFSAFTLNSALDPGVLKSAFFRIKHVAPAEKWDVVLIDHRTGLASSVLPTFSAWPGSTVMMLRSDSLSLPAIKIAEVLLSSQHEFPGAFVCFSLDPERAASGASPSELRVRHEFLTVLAKVMESDSEPTDDHIDPQDLEEYFVNWHHDYALLSDKLPDVDSLSKDNQNALATLREVINLQSVKKSTGSIRHNAPERSPSGAIDAGWFIETTDISRLMQPNSSISYIFGRKGTGKTRIYREMAERSIGVPLLAAADYMEGGLRAQSVLARGLLAKCSSDFESFWWALMSVALECYDSSKQAEKIAEQRAASENLLALDISKIAHQMQATPSKKTFLIDGVETAVGAKQTKQLVEALFRFLSTLQNDSAISSNVQFKLFLRPDLSVGIQNIEQQIAGRRLDLRWDELAIFNYMLAEIARNPWFQGLFADACNEISEAHSQIKEGRLDREGYEAILLKIFPTKLRRHNLLTMTFLRTYFSDSVSGSDKRSSFYPRVIGAFLEQIARLGSSKPNEAKDREGRISHTVILEAFEEATKEFINEIKQELYFALSLVDDMDENRSLVDDLVLGLGGLQTPFSLDDCSEKLSVKISDSRVTDRSVREALRQMKDMGIFEIHPADPHKWRAGRLFKEALRMKYVR